MIRVLIAEDSSVIQKILITLLEKDTSINVIATASDGITAVKKALELKPDLILMDYRMPQQNAPECIQQIMRQIPCPILVLTSAEPFEVKRKEVMELGAIGFMEKPKSMDYNSIAIKLITNIKTLSRLTPAKRGA